MIGVYTITNKIDNKIYLGCSIDVHARLKKHQRNLKNKKHPNNHLQSAYNKYGKENFSFEMLEYCEKEILYSQENYWANLLNVHNENFGYNISPTNPLNSHKHISKETRDKISIASKKKIFTTEYRAKLSKGQIGRLPTNGVKVVRLEDNKIYNTLTEAGKDLGIHSSTIYKQLKGITKTAKNYTFKYID